VGIYRCYTNSIGRFYLIDTPGFDDTHKSDTDVLREVAFWLNEAYRRYVKLTGIIYLHRINDVRVGNAAMKNLRMFKRLCGTESLASVVLATTFWDNGPDLPKYLDREHELKTKDDFWRGMIQNQSKVFRQDSGRTSATRIIEYLVQRDRGSTRSRPTLDIQKQMVDQGKTLGQTGAGQEVEVWLTQQREAYERKLALMRGEWEQALRERDKEWQRDLEKNTQEIEAKIRRDEGDRVKLRADNAALHQEQEALLRARAKQIADQLEHERALQQQNASQAQELQQAIDAAEGHRKKLEIQRKKYQQLVSYRCTVM
jgi:hypothetical protein